MRTRRKRRHRPGEGFNLSFLDAISCGFGAIVMLLVLSKIGEPRALEQAVVDLEGQLLELEEELVLLRGESRILDRELKVRREQMSKEEKLVALLQGDLSRIRGEFAASRQSSEIQEILEKKLLAANQELTEEMKRLLGQSYRRPVDDATIGGVPVDSEYIIFVIDNSGSMQTGTWSLVLQKMEEVLDIHPKVKGLQVMNDMGQYMFTRYSGKWIPDTPGRRRVIVNLLRQWNAFSNSNPVEGIRAAIRTFAADDKKISIYVFGDDFNGGSIEAVLQAVEKVNLRDAEGNLRVRIHAVGFPVGFYTGTAGTGIRFAKLMRILCHKNGGTFVGLNTIQP